MKNTLYYGDNLAIMRDHIADESVDLIYLDPSLAAEFSLILHQEYFVRRFRAEKGWYLSNITSPER